MLIRSDYVYLCLINIKPSLFLLVGFSAFVLCEVKEPSRSSGFSSSWGSGTFNIYNFHHFRKRCINAQINVNLAVWITQMWIISAYIIINLIIMMILDYYPSVCKRALRFKIPSELEGFGFVASVAELPNGINGLEESLWPGRRTTWNNLSQNSRWI